MLNMVCSKNVLSGEGVGFDTGLANDFKEEFGVAYGYYLLKWVAEINFVDELCQCPMVDYANIPIKFNATKFYNLVQMSSIDELIEQFTFNFALFTELIYYKEFFDVECKKTCFFFISALFKKLCVFALVWVEKAAALHNSPLIKKLVVVVLSVKIYSIVLLLPITTSCKMFAYFQLLSNKEI